LKPIAANRIEALRSDSA